MFKSADIFNRADLEYRSLETESSYAQMLQGVEQAGHRRRIRLTLIVNFISMLVSIGLFVVSILLLIKYQRLTFILSVLVNGFTVILLIISLIWAFRTNKGLSYAREPGYALSYFVCIGTYASTVFMLVQTAWYLIYKPYHYSYLIGLKVVVDPASKSTFTFERAWNIDSIMFAVILACSFYLGMQLFWFGHVIRKFKSIRYFFTRVVLYMATVGCIGACWMIIYWSNQVLSFREELPKRMGKHLPEMLRVFGWAGVVVCLINTLSNFHRRKHIYTVVAILSGLIFMGLTMTSLMLIKDVRSASYTEPFAAGDCRTTMTAVHEEHIARVCPFEFKYLPTYEACSRKDIVLYWENGSTEIYKALNPKCCPMAKYYYYDPLVMLVFASSIAVFTMMIMGWMGVNLSNMEISILDHGANETTIADIVSIASVLAVAVSFAWIAFRKRADPSSLNNYQVVSYLNPIENRIKGLDLVNDRVYQQYSHIKPADYGDCFKYNTQVFPLPKFDPSSPVCNDSCTHRLAITITNGTLHSDLSKMVEHGASGARPVFFRHCSGSESRNFTFVVGRIQDIQSFLQKSKICLLYKDVVPDVLLYHDQVPSASIDTSGLNEEERKLLAKSSNNKSTEADPIKCGSNATEATPTSCEGFCKVRVEVGKMGQPRTVKGRLYYQMGNTTEEKFDIHPQINITAYINDTQIPVNYTLFERGLFVLENLTVGYATSKFASIKIEDPLGRFVKKIVNIRIPPLDQINSTVSVGRIRLISTSEVVCQPSNASCLTNQKSKFGSVIFLPQVRPYPTPLTLTSPKVIVYENHIRTASEDAAGLPLRVASNRITKHGDSYLEIPSLPFGSYTAVVSLDKYKPSTFFFDVYNETVKLQPVVLEPLLVEHDMKVEAVVEDSGVDVDFKILVKGDSGTSCIISQTNKYCGYSMSVSERVDNISRDVVYIKKLAIADYSAYLSLSPPYVQTCQYSADSPAYNSHLVSAVHWEVLEPSKSLQDVKVTIESASRLHTEKNDTSQPTLIEEKPLLDISLQLPVELPDEELKPHRVIALNGSALVDSRELTTRYGPSDPSNTEKRSELTIKKPDTPHIDSTHEPNPGTTPSNEPSPKESTETMGTLEESLVPESERKPIVVLRLEDVLPGASNKTVYNLFGTYDLVMPLTFVQNITNDSFSNPRFELLNNPHDIFENFTEAALQVSQEELNNNELEANSLLLKETQETFDDQVVRLFPNENTTFITLPNGSLTIKRVQNYTSTGSNSLLQVSSEDTILGNRTMAFHRLKKINTTNQTNPKVSDFETVTNSFDMRNDSSLLHSLKQTRTITSDNKSNVTVLHTNGSTIWTDKNKSFEVEIHSCLNHTDTIARLRQNRCSNFKSDSERDIKEMDQKVWVASRGQSLNISHSKSSKNGMSSSGKMAEEQKNASGNYYGTNFSSNESKTVMEDLAGAYQLNLNRAITYNSSNGDKVAESHRVNFTQGDRGVKSITSSNKTVFVKEAQTLSFFQEDLQLLNSPKGSNMTHKMHFSRLESPFLNKSSIINTTFVKEPSNLTIEMTSSNNSTQKSITVTMMVPIALNHNNGTEIPKLVGVQGSSTHLVNVYGSTTIESGANSNQGGVESKEDVDTEAKVLGTITNSTHGFFQEITTNVPDSSVLSSNTTRTYINDFTKVLGMSVLSGYEQSSNETTTTMYKDGVGEDVVNLNHSMTVDDVGKGTERIYNLNSSKLCRGTNECNFTFDESKYVKRENGTNKTETSFENNITNGTEVSKVGISEQFSNKSIQIRRNFDNFSAKKLNSELDAEYTASMVSEVFFDQMMSKITENTSQTLSYVNESKNITSNGTKMESYTSGQNFVQLSGFNETQLFTNQDESETNRKTKKLWIGSGDWTQVQKSDIVELESRNMTKFIASNGGHPYVKVDTMISVVNRSVYKPYSDRTIDIAKGSFQSSRSNGRVTSQSNLTTHNIFLKSGSLMLENQSVLYTWPEETELANLESNISVYILQTAPQVVEDEVLIPAGEPLTLVSYNYTVSTINETDGSIKIVKSEVFPVPIKSTSNNSNASLSGQNSTGQSNQSSSNESKIANKSVLRGHAQADVKNQFRLVACFTGFGQISMIKLQENGSGQLDSTRCGQLIEVTKGEYSVELLRAASKGMDSLTSKT